MHILTAVVAGFTAGVFVRSVYMFGWEPIAFVLLLAGLVGTGILLKPRKAYALGALFFLFVALGMLRVSLAESPLPSNFASDIRKQVVYTGMVITDPSVRDRTQRIQMRVIKGNQSTNILVVTGRHPQVSVGDKIKVSGLLLTPEPFSSDDGRVFRYDKFLERDGVRFIFNYARVRIIEPASEYSIPAALANLKHTFLDGLRAALAEPYASLAGGIVIGGKSGLGAELQEAFTRSGLIHIVVLSGYNIMIVASWIIAFSVFVFARAESFFGMRVPRNTSLAIGALALLVFVGIAGFTTTAIRATLMALIALYARATGRTYAAHRALLFVVILMLVNNPLLLVFDPGFGLSVVATAGLIWLAPIIETWLVRVKNELLRGAVATALAAQIAVLPLLLYFTGNLSFVAIPANVIAALIVPFSMAFSYLAGFGGIIFGSTTELLTVFIGIPAYAATALLIWLAETSASLPFAYLVLPAFPFWVTLFMYVVLIYFVVSRRLFSTAPPFKFEKMY